MHGRRILVVSQHVAFHSANGASDAIVGVNYLRTGDDDVTPRDSPSSGPVVWEFPHSLTHKSNNALECLNKV